MTIRPNLVDAFIGVAATAIGLESFLIVRSAPSFSLAGSGTFRQVILLLAGWTTVAVGVAARRRYPTRRSWMLLAMVGVALLVAEWDSPTASQAVFSVGLALNAAGPAVIAHFALSFPSGRLIARVDQAIVTIGYVVTIGLLGLAVAATFDPSSSGCSGCPPNLWVVHPDARLSMNLSRLGLRCGLAWSAVVVVAIMWRLIASSAARRRAVGLVWAIAGLDLLAVAASYGHGLDPGFVGADPVQARLWLVQALALLLLAAATGLALVRSRHSQRGLTSLVIDLGNATRPGLLRGALAVRLSDPDLVLGYPIENGRRYVDAEARDVVLTTPHSGRVQTRLAYAGSEIAVLAHRHGILETPEAVGELVSAVYLALENERLRAEALTQLTDLRSSGSRILTAGDEERRRLERDLHDGAQQRLIGLALAMRLLRSRATTGKSHLDIAESEVREAIDDLRRVASGLYPVVLRESGLAAAFAALAEHRLLRIGDIPGTRYPTVVESTAYRLVALASERSPSTVSIDDQSATIIVHVDVEGELPDLTEVRDRATTIGGQLTVSENPALSRVALVLLVAFGT
ncbi:signal transduction histidine kinase [Marmoricola sp. URHA0025 HA25]